MQLGSLILLTVAHWSWCVCMRGTRPQQPTKVIRSEMTSSLVAYLLQLFNFLTPLPPTPPLVCGRNSTISSLLGVSRRRPTTPSSPQNPPPKKKPWSCFHTPTEGSADCPYRVDSVHVQHVHADMSSDPCDEQCAQCRQCFFSKMFVGKPRSSSCFHI